MSPAADRWIRWTTTGCVALLALIAGTVPYLHMHLLVELHGQPGWVAALTPLSVDGMIVAASTTLLADSRAGERGGVLPWEFVHQYFRSYAAPPLAAPVELARHLVFGAIAYARDLGFEPAPGFEAGTSHLGPWDGPSAIGFGCEGKPLFIQGPYDNAAGVMKTLERSTAHGNFDFLVVA